MRKAAVLALGAIGLLPGAYSSQSAKRGLIHIASDDNSEDDKIWTNSSNGLTWYYNYGASPSSGLEDSSLLFVPMLWGASDDEDDMTFYDSVKAQLDDGANITYVLGFNEPDGETSTGGSSISASLAASTWIRQMEPLREKYNITLGAPAVTGSQRGLKWLQSFFTECDGKCNASFMPLHWYGDFESMASWIGQVMAAYPNMTVWMTEYALSNATLEETQSFFNTSMEYFDRMENITHYSYFGSFRSDISNVGPNAAMLTEDGKLTDIGSWYLGGSATGNIPESPAGKHASFIGWTMLVGVVCIFLIM